MTRADGVDERRLRISMMLVLVLGSVFLPLLQGLDWLPNPPSSSQVNRPPLSPASGVTGLCPCPSCVHRPGDAIRRGWDMGSEGMALLKATRPQPLSRPPAGPTTYCCLTGLLATAPRRGTDWDPHTRLCAQETGVT